MGKVVKNESSAKSYNYASLADIVKQGYELPKMKTGTENNKEYVFYKDGEDWIRGAEIVLPENIVSRDGKRVLNSAQLYGAALTFARRYTTLMALCLTTDDDVDIEVGEEQGKIFDEPLTHQKLVAEFKEVCDAKERLRILEGLKLNSEEDMSNDFLEQYVAFYKKKNEQK